MIRHVTITALIVGAVYGALLWVNADLLGGERSTWEDFSAYEAQNRTNRPSSVGISSVDGLEQSRHSPNSEESHFAGKANTATHDTGVNNDTESQHDLSTDVKVDTVVLDFWIAGTPVDITLSDPNTMRVQIEQAWATFNSNTPLHATVKWEGNNNSVYAYYHDFDREFTTAKIIIGYRNSTTSPDFDSVFVPQGTLTRYPLGEAGEIPKQAWDQIYPNGALLERYSVNAKGETLSKHAWVVD